MSDDGRERRDDEQPRQPTDGRLREDAPLDSDDEQGRDSHQNQGHDLERPMTDDVPWGALARYGRGDGTAEEVAALHDWVGAEASRRMLFDEVRRLGELSQRIRGGVRTDAAWARIRQAIADDAPSTPVLLLEPPSMRRTMPLAGLNHYSERRRRRRRLAIAAGIAAVLVAFATAESHLLDRYHNAVTPPMYREVAAPRGGRVTLGLPDGTRVVLGPESRIRYAVDRGVRVRNVYLEGGVRFDVAHDTAHPFVVHAPGGEAQAMGTSFGVRAYPADSTLTVVVAEGVVALRSGGGAMGSGTMLEPGQRAVLSHGLVRVEPNVDVDRELGWTGGRLAYDLVPLGMVVRDLERWFDVRITVADSSWKRVRITATLDADSIDASLRRLAAVLETGYRRVGADVRLGI